MHAAQQDTMTHITSCELTKLFTSMPQTLDHHPADTPSCQMRLLPRKHPVRHPCCAGLVSKAPEADAVLLGLLGAFTQCTAQYTSLYAYNTKRITSNNFTTKRS